MPSIEIPDDGSRVCLDFMDGLPLGHEVVSSGGDPAQIALLKDAVFTLYDSDDPEDVFDASSITVMFRHAPNVGLNPAVDKDYILEWIVDASDADLLAFCDWNVSSHAAQEQAQRQVMPELQDDVREKMQRLIGCSLFPKSVAGLLEKAITQIGSFRSMDSFDCAGAAGFCSFLGQASFVATWNLFEDSTLYRGAGSRMKRNALHEYIHAIGAATARGFMLQMTKGRKPKVPVLGRIAEEALASHAVQVAYNVDQPEPEIMIPHYRSTDNPKGSYTDLREFMGTIIEYGERAIPMDLVSAAFFEAQDWRSCRRRRELQARVNRNFGQLVESTEEFPFDEFASEYEDARSIKRGELISDALYTMRSATAPSGRADLQVVVRPPSS